MFQNKKAVLDPGQPFYLLLPDEPYFERGISSGAICQCSLEARRSCTFLLQLCRQKNSFEMHLRVIAVKTLKEYWIKNLSSKQSLLAWYEEAEDAKWNNPNELKQQYTTHPL